MQLSNPLKAFLKDGKIPMANNYAEQAIRPFTIARKNFVLIDSSKSATASACSSAWLKQQRLMD